jgi:hypothetical protein
MTIATRLHGLVDVMAYRIFRPSQCADVARWLANSKRSAMEARSPSWPHQAIAALDRRLPRDAKAFEFGGGLTVWPSDRVFSVTCLEHDLPRCERLKMATGGWADQRLAEPATTDSITPSTPLKMMSYVSDSRSLVHRRYSAELVKSDRVWIG